MKYISTRGQSFEQSFLEILLAGLAPDGGLYLPETYPKFSAGDLASMQGMGYQQLAFTILSRFADDIPPDVLKGLIDRTYTAEVFGYGRPDSDASQITPVRRLEDNLYILELSNGPTLAFKDVAMQLLGNLFEYALNRAGQDSNILGATSGDTGSAAEYAMRGKRNVRVFMLSPEHGMTRFQRAQMYSLQEPNIYNIAIRGVFDDCQDIVKAISNDHTFKAECRITAVNSINWARIAAQVVYYFKAYFAVMTESGGPLDFAVPSGNFGDACAGHIARMMGLPIRKIIIATNENDVLCRFFRTGVYRPRPSGDVAHTDCPSMDISKASNFERFMADVSDRNYSAIRVAWGDMESGKTDGLTFWSMTKRIREQFGVDSGSSSKAERMRIIRDTWERYGIVVDPHTAAGIDSGLDRGDIRIPLVCLETALPAKFEDAITEALGRKPERPESLVGIEDLPQRVITMDPDVGAVKAYIAKQCSV